MLGPDARIVEARRNRMAFQNLSILVLQQISAVAVKDAGAATEDRSRMLAGRNAVTARFDADDFNAFIVEERMEETHRVRTAADAGDECVGQPALDLLQL